MTNDEEATEPVDNPAEEAAEVANWEQEGVGEAVNLVPTLLQTAEGAEFLEKEGKRLVRAIKRDDESRQDWLTARAEEMKLYAGVAEKAPQSIGGGNAPLDPIGTRILLQLWSRGCDQMLPAKGALVQVQPNSPEDVEPAARREKHLNWQLRHKIPNWIAGVRDSYLRWLMAGSEFREKMWDPVLKCTRIEGVSADDIIVHYSRKDIDKFMSEVPRVTRRIRKQRWQLEEYADAGMLDPQQLKRIFDKETPTVEGEAEETVIEELGIKLDGVEKPDSNEDKELRPRELYRCQTWLKLPQQERMKPVMVIIDRKTSIILGLTVREDEDPFDKMRFDAETKEWQFAAQNIATQYQQMVAQGVPVPPPQQPPPPKPVRMKTIHSFLHYRLFTNPAGFYGIGVMFLLKNSNLMINKLSMEYLASARFANVQGGLVPKGTNQKRGPLEMEMGKWHETELTPEEMSGIRPFNMHPPADGLWKFIGKLREDCSTLIADADTLSGEAGPTNETKAAAERRNFNATALVSTIVALFTETLAEEVKLIAHDNRSFMEEKEYFYFTEDTHQKPQQIEVYREDYLDEFHFTFTADQRIQTRPERIQAATATLQQISATPTLVNDPVRGPAVTYAALMEYFKALEKPDMMQALGPPPQPPPPPQMMSQEDENAGFMNDQDHPVFPEDPHEDHLAKMMELEASDYHQNMSPSGKAMFDKHKRAHIAEIYKRDQARANAERMAAGQGMGGGPGYSGIQGPPPGAGGPTPVQGAGQGAPGLS